MRASLKKKTQAMLSLALLLAGTTAQASTFEENISIEASNVMTGGFGIDAIYIDVDNAVADFGLGLNYRRAIDITPTKSSFVDTATAYFRVDYRIASKEQNTIEQKEMEFGLNLTFSDSLQVFAEVGVLYDSLELSGHASTTQYDTSALGMRFNYLDDFTIVPAIEYRNSDLTSDFGYSITFEKKSSEEGIKPSYGYKQIGDEKSVFVNLLYRF